MKKIRRDKSLEKSYPPCVFWRDDLEEFIEEMKTSADPVEIYTDDYQFDSIADAAKHFGSKSVFDLKISVRRPSMSVEMSRMTTKLYASADAAKAFYSIDRLILNRRRLFPVLYGFWAYPLAMVLTASIAQIKMPYADVVGFGLFLLATIFHLRAAFLSLRRHSVIHLTMHTDARSFWESNWDKIVLSVVVCVSTLLVTKLVNYLVP